MNKIIIGLVFLILGSIVAYFLSTYINSDLKRTSIDRFNYLVTIIGGVAYLAIYVKYGFDIYSILLCVLSSILLLIGAYDYISFEVRDIFLVSLGVICVLLLIYRIFVLKDSILDYLFSFVITLVFFVALVFIGRIIYKKDALGMGDVYLACIISIIYKPFVMIVSILIGSFVGSVIEIVKMKINKTAKDMEIAFCPYLCFGFYMGILFTNEIMSIL